MVISGKKKIPQNLETLEHFFSHETSCLLHMAISKRKKILKIWLLMSHPGFMPLGNPN
jgi:hypothetical protein